MPDVASGVADEGEGLSREVAARCSRIVSRSGEGLAGVELIGEGVDDGYVGVPGHLFEATLFMRVRQTIIDA